jgi:hypothetical protein
MERNIKTIDSIPHIGIQSFIEGFFSSMNLHDVYRDFVFLDKDGTKRILTEEYIRESFRTAYGLGFIDGTHSKEDVS